MPERVKIGVMILKQNDCIDVIESSRADIIVIDRRNNNNNVIQLKDFERGGEIRMTKSPRKNITSCFFDTFLENKS